ncbi:DUF6624 domain-containing protein [Chitinophaga sp. Cy-1792]|uniref:DUF6624 domain-containing protein n=1 Tax=Chitinophaga sp. Cy-1792 TaxID=2608339 RepID=UPI0014236FD1|nr:DUF6624 domain-containing protein [Chitinophaga sp. Cy-1792]NIG53415.1 hypothetical protein [Chitinophaga sp. Cy-1792]
MNSIKYFFLVILTCTAFYAHAQVNAALSRTIDSLYNDDQAVQWQFREMHLRNAPADSIKRQDSLKKAVYRNELEVVKKIYAQYGYPTAAMVGPASSHNFFVLIQHADHDPAFQKQLLPVLDTLSLAGEISRKDYAYLYDRIQHNTGGKQLYGTQPVYGKNGNLFDSNNKIMLPPDLEDPENVDKRRKEIGLEPMEEYYETVLKALGRPRVKP